MDGEWLQTRILEGVRKHLQGGGKLPSPAIKQKVHAALFVNQAQTILKTTRSFYRQVTARQILRAVFTADAVLYR